MVFFGAVEHDGDVAVGGLEGADAAQVLAAIGGTRVGDACVEVVDVVVQAHACHDFEHGDVDAFALARGARVDHACEGGAHRVHGGEVVAGNRRGREGLVDGAVLSHVAAEGLDHVIVRRTADAVGRAVLAEAGNVNDDELGVDLPQHIVAEALALVGRALARLDEDVGVLDETEEHLASFFAEGIHGNALLVATRLLLDEHGVAHRVAVVGVFHPDDVGAPVGHHGRCGRCGHFDCLIDDFDAIERTEGRFVLSEFHSVSFQHMRALRAARFRRARSARGAAGPASTPRLPNAPNARSDEEPPFHDKSEGVRPSDRVPSCLLSIVNVCPVPGIVRRG